MSPRVTEGDPFRVATEDQGLLTRPLRPSEAWFRRERRSAWFLATSLWLCVGLGALWTTLFVIDIERVRRIWTEGLAAEDVVLRGQERSRAFILRDTRFQVEYTDRAGGRHRGETSFLSIAFGGEARADLRYDPEHPDDFATSFEYQRTYGRVTFTGLLVVMLIGAGVALSTSSRRKLRELADVREIIHAGGVAVPLVIDSQRSEVHQGRVIAIDYTLRLPGGGIVERRCLPERPPFLLHVATNRVLGLVHPRRPDLIVILEPDLAPLEVEPSEAEMVRKRYQAQREASRRG